MSAAFRPIVPDDLLVELRLDGRAVAFLFADDEHEINELRASLLPQLPCGHHVVVNTAAADGDSKTGGRVWHSAPVLCQFLREWQHAATVLDVLELGSGTGACGLWCACGALRARRVVLTDGDEALLPLMTHNWRKHSHLICSEVSIESLRWGCRSEAALPKGSYDLLIGSDVIYDWDDHEALCVTLSSLMRRDVRRAPRAVFATMPRHRVAAPATIDGMGAAARGEPRREVLHSSGHVLREPSTSPSGLFTDQALVRFVRTAASHGLRVSPGGAAGVPAHRRGSAENPSTLAASDWPLGFAWTADEFRELHPFVMIIDLDLERRSSS